LWSILRIRVMIVMMSSRVKAVYAAAPAGGDLEPTCGRNRTFSQLHWCHRL